MQTENTIVLEFCEECNEKRYRYCQCGQICESENHIQCYDYGEEPVVLWQCPGCQKWLCYTDGMADSNSSLCDSYAATQSCLDFTP